MAGARLAGGALAALKRWRRQSYVLATARDWARRPGLRLRGRDSPREEIGGVEFVATDLQFKSRPSYHRDRALLSRMREPLPTWSYPGISCAVDPSTLQPPIVFATFHFGALPAMGALFEQMPGPVVMPMTGAFPRRRGFSTIDVRGGEWARIRALKTAVDILRAGGFVFMPVDWKGNAEIEVRLFDRHISLPRGAFAMSRLADAPIMPVTGRWRGSRVRVVLGEAIPPGDEREMATALASWLESYLRENPRQITRPIVDLIRSGS